MGVKSLTALLQRLAPESVRVKHISHYKGKTLAVDISCFLNRFNPHPARVQRGVYRLCVYFQLNGIKPIFVFDGPDRISEKRREVERRNALKDRVEKSFQLEKNRKTRLSGLKGSARLLQNYPPEKVSSILENIQLSADDPPFAATSRMNDTAAETSKATANPNLDVDFSMGDLHLISLEDINCQEDGHELELMWHLPTLSEDLPRLPDEYFPDPRYLSMEGESVLQDFIDHGEVEGLFEHDLFAPSHLELDVKTAEDLDLINDLSSDMDRAHSANPGDGGLNLARRTGTSIQNLIPADEVTHLPLDSTSDTVVRQKVHRALLKFVTESEFEGDADEITNNSTQRQKELNLLEQKLVQEIKEVVRSNNVGRENQDGDLLASKGSDLGSDISSSLSPVTQTPQLETQSTRESGPSQIQSDFKEDTMDGLELERKSLLLSECPVHDKTGPHQNEQGNAGGKPVVVNPVIEEQEVLLAENPDPTNENTADNEMDIAAEASQDQDLQTMMKDVLSTHQTLFMTLERRTMRITQPLIRSCQKLLKAMGQPVVVAYDAEAEAVCARMNTLGIVDASVSEDTDTAVFGDGLLLRQVGVSEKKDIIEIDPLVAHKCLGLSRDAFRDMCILCGTDFSGTIEGIGPQRAAKLIRRYGSIESVLANISNRPRPDFTYDQARRVFDRVPTIPEDPDAYLPKPEIQPLLQQLISKYEIDPDDVEAELNEDIKAGEFEVGENRDVFGGSVAANNMGADPFKASILSSPDLKKTDYLEDSKM
ncbi:Elongation of fatty acids protein 2 [Mortierella sp. AM989]|nr:Elongation of fatty acids protein 2 [Mortierella sp. AM989]